MTKRKNDKTPRPTASPSDGTATTLTEAERLRAEQYVFGALPRNEVDAFEAAIANSDLLRAHVEALQRTTEWMLWQPSEREPSPGLRLRLMERIRNLPLQEREGAVEGGGRSGIHERYA